MVEEFKPLRIKRYRVLTPLFSALASLLIILSPSTKAWADAPPTLEPIDLAPSVAKDFAYCAVINNYDPANTYTFIPVDDSGATGYLWHVEGQHRACANLVSLPGSLAEFDLVASRDGFASSTVRLSGRSLANSPIHISIISYEPTADGFILEVTPRTFPDEIWTLNVFAGQVRLRDATHLVVTGLNPGQSTNGSIVASLPNYYASILSFVGTALTEVEVRQKAEAKAKAESERARLAVESATNAYLERVRAEKAKAEEEAESKAAKVQTADLAAVSRLVENPESTSTAEVQKLTPNQVSLIGIREFRKLPLEVFTGLSAKQASGLTAAQVKSLTIPKLRKLSPTAIGSLKPEALGSLSVAKLKSLTKAQVAQIWLAQLLQLDADQRKALRR